VRTGGFEPGLRSTRKSGKDRISQIKGDRADSSKISTKLRIERYDLNQIIKIQESGRGEIDPESVREKGGLDQRKRAPGGKKGRGDPNETKTSTVPLGSLTVQKKFLIQLVEKTRKGKFLVKGGWKEEKTVTDAGERQKR